MKNCIFCITLFFLGITQGLAQNKQEIRLDRRYTQALLPNDSLLPLKEMVKGRPVWSIMDLRTRKVTPLPVDTLHVWSARFLWDGKIIAAKNGKWGIVAPSGQIILPFEYDQIECYSLFPWFIKKGSLWGLLNRQGQPIVTPMYQSLGHPDTLCIMATLPDGQWGLLDKQGKVLVPFNSYPYTNDISPDRNLVAFKNEEGESALFNIQLQEWVLPFERQRIEFQTLSSGQATQLIVVRMDDNYGIGDAEGRMITPVHYDHIYWATDNLPNYATAQLTDPQTGANIWHFIDEKGQVVGTTAAGYDNVDGVCDGLAAFRTEAWKYGFLKPDGSVAIPPVYSQVKPFRSGQALVHSVGDTCKIIDKAGNVVQTYSKCSNIRFEQLLRFASFTEGHEKYGIMDKNKKVIILPSEHFNNHFTMTDLPNDMIHISSSNGKEGVLKTNGTILFQPIYDEIIWDSESSKFVLYKGGERFVHLMGSGKISKDVPVIRGDDDSPEWGYGAPVIHSKYGQSIMTNPSFALFKDGGQLVLVYRK